MADTANSVIKSKFVARYGPGRAGFGVLVGDLVTANKNNRFWTDIDGTKRPLNTDGTKLITANLTLVAADSGATVVFNSTTSLIVTLPTPAVGLAFKFFVKTLPTDSGVGSLIKTGASEKIYSKVSASGATITESAGKGVVNTYGTQVKGDGGMIHCDGTDWVFIPTGVWAREA